ncbi:DUF2784 domain-containing protein [Alteromonas ponticola]|uniref:DUF2784 domain-containing protein n=1 Tax=Alteromonas aquimaris TaxID=2998417 RepID=A0ABT3P5B0_9ALTE|nr:DUF2784 domain-containing protein [Alteromonas aquimaris]MCW8107945.1 DUF2784 domain-containing protein [Alteromonas aquimaris]
MKRESLFIFLADAILIVHVLFVLFVVLGLVAVYVGYFMGWQWVRIRTFRILHLLAIVFVTVQAWMGARCPLTHWEIALRTEAGQASYAGSFIQHWLQQLLYYNAPDWVFVLLYTCFASAVGASWFIVRPEARTKQ